MATWQVFNLFALSSLSSPREITSNWQRYTEWEALYKLRGNQRRHRWRFGGGEGHARGAGRGGDGAGPLAYRRAAAARARSPVRSSPVQPRPVSHFVKWTTQSTVVSSEWATDWSISAWRLREPRLGNRNVNTAVLLSRLPRSASALRALGGKGVSHLSPTLDAGAYVVHRNNTTNFGF